MSTSKHIDKICLAVVAVTLVITILFMNGAGLGLTYADRVMGYEQRLFSTDTVHEIDLVMDDWDSFIESCENEEYTACTAVIDGEAYKNIGIRAKGNTSLSNVKSLGSERYSFKLEFDQYETGKSYYGLDKLCLNNLIQDNTMMKDYIVYQMMQGFGADTPLCSFVYITVNGEDWGLYLAVEGVEDSFLQRNYGSDSGELYKPDSMSFGGGRGNGKDFNMDDFDFGGEESGDAADMADFFASMQENGEIPEMPSGGEMPEMSSGGGEMPTMPQDGDVPEMPSGDGEMPTMPQDGDVPEMPSGDGEMPSGDGEDSGKASHGGGMGGMSGMGSDDVKLKYIDDDPDSYSNIFDNAKTDVSAADQERLIQALENLSSYTDLENTLDMDEVLRYFVVHNFVCNGDSYTGSMIHNYYLHEQDGKLGMIPWDYNLAFGTFQSGNASSSVNASIDNPVSGGDPDDRPMLGWIFSDESYTESYHELFSEFLTEWIDSGELSEMIETTAALIAPYVEKDPTKFCTVEEFESGVEALSQFVTLRAEAVRRQLQGDNTAVDTGDLDLSAMGTMGSGMGGGFTPGSSSSAARENASQEDTAQPDDGTQQDGSTQQSGGTAPQGGDFPQGGGTAPQGGDFPQSGGTAPQGGNSPQGGGTAPQGGNSPQGGGTAPQGGDPPQGGMAQKEQ